ncbi:cysteine desulfurase family protein [Nesterenkonia alkaliphila]|uniref:Aminotransferase class V-fold PLP-dependent enzyme n=1 Tax=Nesterenkonia alkaliphila TaxID=1463631 RepID=A0A7K1UGI1_9MICC|nr:cysteine desulfurase family protein [Nesterenkonia alkaliphila]MVT25201.1 aminotransferase class V-fold PLP-dependent enzyme [Nesterenkonia alkaliphila]GFZ97637.1 cysteine desulfurase [Nesterenkonia alkaliphila]
MIYLDEAASAPPKREVLEAMWPHLTSGFANPASRHDPGLAAERALEDARRQVAAHLGARPAEIIFTSGGTESDNAAVKGIALAAPRGRHVLVSAVEHPAVLESAEWLGRMGFQVQQIPVDTAGVVTPEALAGLLRPDTTLVSVQAANGEVGTVQDIASLSAVAAQHGVPFHTDAVQAAGAMPLDVDELGVQALSLAGHKLGTPKGVGALYLRRRTPFEPLIHGGGQQRGQRSGTENVAAAVGMAMALELAVSRDVEAWRRSSEQFVSAVEEAVPGARLTGHRTQRLPGHASFVLRGRSGESVLLDLQEQGVCCSSGSACAAGSSEPSPVLTAMGYSADQAQAALRFTFGAETPEDHLHRAVAALRNSAPA